MKLQKAIFSPVHSLPNDLKAALTNDAKAFSNWDTLSLKAKNEWICWTISVKQAKTRTQHVERAVSELADGKRRPCCWIGCIHRADKPIGSWLQKRTS